MTKPIVLIIDDEPDIRELLEITLMRMGLETHSAATAAEAYSELDKQRFQLCLTDMKLPDGNGLEIIESIQQQHPQLPVAMITAYGSVDTAIDALKAGAFDFISKPIDLDRIRQLVTSALNLEESDKLEPNETQSGLLGNSDKIEILRQQTRKLARSQAPVFIHGESGSGKEVVARLIHSSGPRANGPFIAVNCGAIPSELMESEFFGHVKGSFTGAYGDKQGLFEAAHSGTLFLDEVADLPLPMQVKLLRAIQEKVIRKIGSNQEVKTDIRILSATHKDLSSEVDAGHFRQDLYYRINVISLHVPSLKERSEDIPLLANAIIRRISNEWEMPPPTLTDSAMQALKGYHFPGNVRELENILERALTMSDGSEITEPDLALPSTVEPHTMDARNIDTDAAMGNLDGYLEAIERDIITEALERTRWNRTSAAKLLGISFRQMRYRLQKLGLE